MNLYMYIVLVKLGICKMKICVLVAILKLYILQKQVSASYIALSVTDTRYSLWH
jgi:hypothetical protein